jgi:hypothetical protein
MYKKVEDYYIHGEYNFDIIVDKTTNLDYVYEFGVYGGKSMLELLKLAYLRDKPVKNFFGFDIFSGLPEDDIENVCPDWKKGNFAASNLFNRPPEQCAQIVQTLGHTLFPSTNICIITSLFKDIKFTPEFRPADFINIDCDLYSSTIDILEFMIQNNLIKQNTTISYDDLVLSHGREFKCGEGRAHKEIMEKYKINYIRLGDSQFQIKLY